MPQVFRHVGFFCELLPGVSPLVTQRRDLEGRGQGHVESEDGGA